MYKEKILPNHVSAYTSDFQLNTKEGIENGNGAGFPIFFYLRSGAMATQPKALAFSAAHRRTIQSGWVSSGFGCFVVCLNHFEPGLNIFEGHLYQLKQSRKCVT